MQLSITSFKRNFGATGEIRYEFSHGNTLIGVASVSSNQASHFIHFITVMPDDRGKGYGSAILEALCQMFNDKPLWLELDASSPFGLDKLRMWYERHGFTQMFGDYMVREPL
ncbi:MAG: GNAT family N-acetyltransferase [Coleofasciculus sp. S288]|nr:GNAT family N-acetyltransferase [Coleofasciculus sp. S288]